ncbi:TRIO and F-actin-binding protein [Pezoporus occidentalis]|uniref:TRIO and F-actin-binding protein n=1 Tax=Pezoporus occidentalis TaxID=407982 RepID=UPI002F90E362
MSGSINDVPCMNFEANTFAKSLCQYCFRAAGAHQHSVQERGVEVAGHNASSNADPGGAWDALHILAPQCEVYVCVSPVEGTERWHESRGYPPLSPGAEGEHRETSTDPSACSQANSTLARDGEMTWLWDNTMGSGKRDMMSYVGHKEEVRSRALQADRPRWAQPIPSGSWVRTEAQDFRKEICPLKAECRPTSQKPEESWPKHRKADPQWPSTPPRATTGSSRSDPLGGSGRLACSQVREPRGQPGSRGTEGRHGLDRQEYTVLASLPKRLSQRDAVDRCGSRMLSPGRVEVERMFGCERRKSETLEAFQALEEGRVDRLDGKTPVPPSKGRLARRQSSPSLPREGQRVSWHLEQRSRDPKEPLRSPSPAQHPEKASRSRGDRPHPASASWLLDRGNRSPRSISPAQRSVSPTSAPQARLRAPVSPPWCSEKSWRSQEEPVRAPSSERGRAAWLGGSTGQAPERKSRGDSLHPVGLGKGLDNSRLSRAAPPPRSLSPGRHTESTWRSQKEIAPPVRVAERQWGRPGELLQLRAPGKPSECGWQSLREKLPASHPGKGTGTDWKGQGKPSRPVSPTRALEQDWRGRGEAHQAQAWQRDWKRQEKPVCHADLMRQLERDWKSPTKGPSVRLQPDDSWKRPESPAQQLEDDWKGPEHTRNTNNPEKPLESDWGNKRLLMYHVSRAGAKVLGTLAGMKLASTERVGPLGCSSAHPNFCGSSATLGEPSCLPGTGKREDASHPGPRWEVAAQIWETEARTNPHGFSSCFLSLQPQLCGDAFPPQSSTRSSGSLQPRSNDSEKRNKPDLLNFKKGWMSILDEPGEWKKHWFVLTDSSLRYYRDSNAEEADDLDGEIDLRSCTDVTEFAVQRNYGFQIHTKDAVFTLSAMTSGIRRNWIEALRKNVRPVSAPDVTKLSDCDKENFRNCVPQKGSLRTEEQQRLGSSSEGNSKGSPWKADGQRHAFDYVELSPLPQDPGNQGSPQRTRGSLRVSERAPKHEELERDLAVRSEERRKWFEAPDVRVPNSDGSGGDSSRKVGELDLPTPPLSEDQRIRLKEEIEKKWLELERLPLKDSRRVPLTALLNQSKGNHGDTNEALKKEIQSLRAQLESCWARNESLREAAKSQGDCHVPRGYISQEACERSLAAMESSHQQVMEELQRHHQRELERLRQEKERLLAEEAAATAAAIEALKKAHREEMNKELCRTRSFQQCSSVSDALQKQHQLDVESLKRELQVLSEQYSQKCLEIGELTQKAEEREQTLQHCQQEGKELLRKNQELQTRLSDEIGKLRSFISSRNSGDRSPNNNERSSCELEVLLRVKENELQYLKKEVQCLREELQMMQKDKRFASGKYQDVYAELNHIKVRSEREIEQLKEHLRLAMAALQEKESLRNSVSE